MAESFAFDVAGQILGKLTSLAIREIGLIWGVKSDLKRLETTVSSIQAVLLDAAEQKKTSKHVDDWLEKLHDVLEDATDLLDDYMTEELRHQVVIKGSKRKAVKNFFSKSNSLLLRIEMSRRLQDIRSNLEDVDVDRKRFQFAEYVPDRSIANRKRREQTHSFVRASEVIGRESDINRIISLLLGTPTSSGSNMTTAENIHILPIVGLGGLGKTTLAKLAYNDNAISSHFELKLWICVSDEFDVKDLIEKIMKDATGGFDHSHLDLNQLQLCLRTTLESTKFLLVLDDVWTDDLKTWIELKELLQSGAQGSKVLVTTRKRITAKIMGTFTMYELKGLSDDECVSIFNRCVFTEGEAKQHTNLLEIGKEIVKKCNGLPLAVKSLGSILFTKREEREWVHIRDTGIWEIAQKGNDVIPILKLSYDDMPPHLKHCFAYCAIFPKDYEISEEIVSRWMAHGLLSSHYESVVLEDIGDQYLNELISLSFFQDVKHYYNGSISSFKMHDLVHDLALSVAGKTVSHIKFNSTSIIYEKTRHLLICEQSLEGKGFPNFLLKLGKLHALHFMFPHKLINKIFFETLLKTFTSLRDMHLNQLDIEELPTSIGLLKNLRYLDLSNNSKIKRLPNNICNLINLQTLRLDGCIMLQDLPREFGNLWSLRCLYLSGEMKYFPVKGVAEGLTSLQQLWVTECAHLESFLEGIQYFTALRTLSIFECPNLTSLRIHSMSYLTSLEHLFVANCEKLKFSDENSKMMELPRGFLSLTLVGLPHLKELPCEIQGDSPRLQSIDIFDCNSFTILPEWLKKCTSLSKLRLINVAENLYEECQIVKYYPFISHISQFDIA